MTAFRSSGEQHEDSVEEIYRRYAAWLHSRLSRGISRQAAEDIVQETFLRLARHRANISIDHPRALLLTIARNISISARKKETRAWAAQASLESMLSQGSMLADQVETLSLIQVICALPAAYRDVFVLSRFQGLTYEQIAQARGISVKTVEWRMTRALALCAASLRD